MPTAPGRKRPRRELMRPISPDRWWTALSCRPPEQAEGPESQDCRHRAEDDEIGQFRKHDLPDRVQHADNERADRRADQAAASADDHDGEREDEDLGGGTGIERENGAAA